MPIPEQILVALNEIFDEINSNIKIDEKNKISSRRIKVNNEDWKIIAEWFEKEKRYIIRFDNRTARFNKIEGIESDKS
jgi:hypothetical protein